MKKSSPSISSSWRLQEVGFGRLDEYICGLVSKSSRGLSRPLNEAEGRVYREEPSVRDAVWISYIRFAISLLLVFVVLIVFGVPGALARDSSPGIAIFLTGLAFFLVSLRGQLAVAAMVDLLLVFAQVRIRWVAGRVGFTDLYRRVMIVYPIFSAFLVWWLYVSGNLQTATGL